MYDLVFAANQKYIDSSASATNGIQNIRDAINNDLVETITCIEGLDAAAQKTCTDNAQKTVRDMTVDTRVRSRPPAFVNETFPNFFSPNTVKRALSKSLFDMSFMYLEHYGFHDQVAEGIYQCAKTNCASKESEIRSELRKALDDFSPAKRGGSQSAGAHPDLEWSQMVQAYDGESSALPSDNYNMWALVGIKNVTTVFNDMSIVPNVSSVAHALNEKKQQSWFTATQLAAVHDFNYWCLFDPEIGLFGHYNSSKTDAEYLAAVKAKTEFTQTFSTKEEFFGMVHTEAKNWMVNSGHMVHFQGLVWPSTVRSNAYQKFMNDISGAGSVDLWKELGYRALTATRTPTKAPFKNAFNAPSTRSPTSDHCFTSWSSSTWAT